MAKVNNISFNRVARLSSVRVVGYMVKSIKRMKPYQLMKLRLKIV